MLQHKSIHPKYFACSVRAECTRAVVQTNHVLDRCLQISNHNGSTAQDDAYVSMDAPGAQEKRLQIIGRNFAGRSEKRAPGGNKPIRDTQGKDNK
jgi:hypothetical protein